MHKVRLPHSIKGWWTPSKYRLFRFLSALFAWVNRLVVLETTFWTFKQVSTTKNGKLAMSLSFCKVARLLEGGFCVFWMILSHLLDNSGNLRVAAFLCHWASRVVLSWLRVIVFGIWWFDKMLFFLGGGGVLSQNTPWHRDTHAQHYSLCDIPKGRDTKLGIIFDLSFCFCKPSFFFFFFLVCNSSKRSKSKSVFAIEKQN